MTLLNKEAAKSKVKRLLYDYFAIPLCHIRIFKIIPRTNFVQKHVPFLLPRNDIN